MWLECEGERTVGMAIARDTLGASFKALLAALKQHLMAHSAETSTASHTTLAA